MRPCAGGIVMTAGRSERFATGATKTRSTSYPSPKIMLSSGLMKSATIATLTKTLHSLCNMKNQFSPVPQPVVSGNLLAQHTPGPWHYDPVWSLVTGPQGGEQQICAIHGSESVPKQEAAANAKLIASAPNLLAACEIGLAYAMALAGRAEAKGETIIAKQALKHAETIRAAIALARKGQL
jgi:hypothetical protein